MRIPEEEQGFIRYTCLTYGTQTKEVCEKIDRLCAECGGEYSDALKEVMCSRRSIYQIGLKYHVSERTIYRIRKKFYESWRSP